MDTYNGILIENAQLSSIISNDLE